MNKEELEEATDLILDRIMTSQLSNYTKVELMINLKKILENYDDNIRTLSKIEKEKRFLKNGRIN